MQLYFNLFGHSLPSYGAMIATGIVISNILAITLILRMYELDLNDFIILEAYCFLGAFLGAKILYLIVSYKEIKWNRFFDLHYFNVLMQSGFVFYGGMIGGLCAILVAGKVHKINYKNYVQHCVFLIPLIHCFGRIGCFLAGCCYGIPYHGLCAVTFPSNSLAPSGIPLFPIQLVEAAGLLLLALGILLMDRFIKKNTLVLYLFGYGCLRFGLEFLRNDGERGHLGKLSTSQWISVLMIILSVIIAIAGIRKSKNQTES